MRVRSATVPERVQYIPHDGKMPEILLHRDVVELEEGGYEYDELRIDGDYTKEYVEEHFDELWPGYEPTIDERLESYMAETDAALFDLDTAQATYETDTDAALFDLAEYAASLEARIQALEA